MERDVIELDRRGLLLIVLLSCLLLPGGAQSAHAQQEAEPVDVADVSVQLVGTNVQVYGKVINRLPWDVDNVRVTVHFQDGLAEMEVPTEVGALKQGRERRFAVTQHINDLVNATFGVEVTSYTIKTTDVPNLMKWFGSTNTGALRPAVIQTFDNMSDSAALEPLVTCVTSSEASSVELDKAIEDILCLDGLYVLQSPQSVDGLLTLLARYQKEDALDLGLFFSLGLNVEGSLLQDMKLKEVVAGRESTASTFDIVIAILRSIGTSGWPALIRSSADPDPGVRAAAEQAIDALELPGVEQLLGVEDATLRREMIGALGKAAYPGAVLPLLEAARDDPLVADSVPASLAEMGAAAVPELVAALRHPDAGIADYVENFLAAHVDVLGPVLRDRLREQAPGVPLPTSDLEVVAALRAQADQAVWAEAEPYFQRSLAQYQARACLDAVNSLAATFAIRNRTPHTGESVAILMCGARVYLQNEDYQDAVAVGRQALDLTPNDSALRQELAGWLALLGDRAASRLEAIGYYRSALGLNPEAVETYQRLVLATTRQYWLYTGSGLALLIVGFVIAVRSRNPD